MPSTRPVLLLMLLNLLQGAPTPTPVARLTVDGTAQGISLDKAQVIGPGKVFPMAWLKEKALQGALTEQPMRVNTWTEIGLAFVPDRDGQVSLILSGYDWRVEGKKRPVLTCWDDVTVTGATLENGTFEDLVGGEPARWFRSGTAEPKAMVIQAPLSVRSGKVAIRTWLESGYFQKISVQKGVPVTVRAWVYLPTAEKAAALDLGQAGNMALADEIDGDRKGGWTDQGKQNDLSALKPGDRTFAGIPFRIAEGPKAAIVLKGPARDYFPEKAELRFPSGITGNFVYLLHGLAWAPRNGTVIGKIIPILATGDGQPVEVVCGRDGGNWWSPSHYSNAYAGFTAENKTAFVGLHVSRFPLPIGTLGVRFESIGNAVWGIAGAALSEEPLDLPKAERTVVTEGGDWVRYAWDKEIVSGSAMDFSFLLDAPAGNRGFVKIAPDATLRFEKDGTPFRYVGNNLANWGSPSYLARLSKEQRVLLAERLARLGHNLFRIAYHDNGYLKRGGAESEVDPAGIEALDQFTFELKKRGVYLTGDFWMDSARAAVIREAYPGQPTGNDPRLVKALYQMGYYLNNPVIRGDLLKTARLFLEHVNPYTGLAAKDEPQWVYFDILNESPLHLTALKGGVPGRIFAAAWNDHLRKAYGSTAALSAAWPGVNLGGTLEQSTAALPTDLEEGPRGEELVRYFTRLHKEGYDAMKGLMKSVGARQILTDINNEHNRSVLLSRDGFDLVDQHGYHDHPEWRVGGATVFNQMPSLSRGSWTWWNLSTYFAVSRHAGKPFVISESQHVFPNRYRNEAGLAMGAQAALQGWDGVLNFNYDARPEGTFVDHVATGFDTVNEPIGSAGERQVKLLFLRGDLKPAPKRVALRVDRDLLGRSNVDFNGGASVLAMATGVGIAFDEPSDKKAWAYQYPLLVAKAGGAWIPGTTQVEGKDLQGWMQGLKGPVLPSANRSDLTRGLLETATGEVNWNFGERVMTVDSPRSKGFVTHTNADLTAPGFHATLQGAPCSLSLHSLDGKPIEESRRLLVFFLTDVLNKGMTFENGNRIVVSYGEPVHLLRAGKAGLRLRNNQPLKAWAIAASGKRLESVPVDLDGNDRTLTLTHRLSSGSTLFWELAVE